MVFLTFFTCLYIQKPKNSSSICSFGLFFPYSFQWWHSSYLHRPLSKTYQEVLRTVFMSSTSSPSRASKKKSTKDLQEEITNLYNNICLFEKGTKLFSGNSYMFLASESSCHNSLCTVWSSRTFGATEPPNNCIRFWNIPNRLFDPPDLVNILY